MDLSKLPQLLVSNPSEALELLNKYYSTLGLKELHSMDDIVSEHATRKLGLIFGFERRDSEVWQRILIKSKTLSYDLSVNGNLSQIVNLRNSSVYLKGEHPFVEGNLTILLKSEEFKGYLNSSGIVSLDHIDDGNKRRIRTIMGKKELKLKQIRDKLYDEGVFSMFLPSYNMSSIDAISERLLQTFKTVYLDKSREDVYEPNRCTIIENEIFRDASKENQTRFYKKFPLL